MKLLHLDASALGGQSVTRELSAALVRRQQGCIRRCRSSTATWMPSRCRT